jgi:hypothetical protein
MATTITSTIGTGGTYSTPSAWIDAMIAAHGSNLVTADQIWRGELKNQIHGGAGAGQVLHIPNTLTTDATRYVELTTEAGASFADHANIQTNALRGNGANGGAMIISDSNFNQVVRAAAAFTRVNKVQILSTATTSGTALLMDGADGIVDRCIMESSSTSGYAFDGSASRHTLKNSLCAVRVSSNTVGIVKFFENATVVNCTLVVPSDFTAASFGIDFSFPNNVTLRNVAVFGVAAVWDTTPSGTFIVATCRSSLTPPNAGFTQITYDTSTGSGFENITDSTRDFRIKSTSAMKDAGTTDATNAAIDIAGTARPSGSAYDIGAWEFKVTSTQAPRAVHLTRMMRR